MADDQAHSVYPSPKPQLRTNRHGVEYSFLVCPVLLDADVGLGQGLPGQLHLGRPPTDSGWAVPPL